MKKRYKRTFLVLYAFCSLLAEGVSAQSLVLSLEKTISLAADSSLEAFRTKNLFLSGYWEFRNYKAERLPSLTLNITPAEYYRDITKRYDSENLHNVERYIAKVCAGAVFAVPQADIVRAFAVMRAF